MTIKQSRYITADTTGKKEMAIRTTELDKVKDDPFVRKSEVQQTVNNSTLPVSSRAVNLAIDSIELPSLDGYATEDYVDQKLDSIDLSSYASTTYVNGKLEEVGARVDSADEKATEALNSSSESLESANTALGAAQDAGGKAQEALDNSSEALVNANTALTVAQGVDDKAQEALDIAQSALDSIPTDYVKGSDFNALSTIVGNKRDLDDNVFNGLMTIKSDIDEQGVGISLQESDGTVRGQVVATDQGLQLTQYPKDGGSQTFTFPGEGGEIGLKNDIINVLSELDNKWDTQDTIGTGKIIREGSYGIGVRKPSLIFGTFKGIHYTHISKIHYTLLDMDHIPSGQKGVMRRMTAKEAAIFLGKPVVTNGMAFKNADGSSGWDNDLIAPNGIYIEKGEVISDWDSTTNQSRTQACCIMHDGTMRRYYRSEANANKMVQDGARLGVSWGAFCVWDGKIPEDLKDAPVATNLVKSARTVLMYEGGGYYSIVTSEGVSGDYGLDVIEAGELAISLGAVSAFILDGGGSTQAYSVNTYVTPSSDASTRTLGTFFTISERPANEFDTGDIVLESLGDWGQEQNAGGAPPLSLRQVGNRVSLTFNAKPFKHGGQLRIPRRFSTGKHSTFRGVFNSGSGYWQVVSGGGINTGLLDIQQVQELTTPTYVAGVLSWELDHK